LAVWRKGSGCSADRWSGCATGRGVTPAQARENIAAHYDLGNTFYAHFLDKELLYSSALFTADEQDLTAAQQAKMARLCDQLALRVRPPAGNRHRLGAMAEYAARHYGCRVTTTTLSQEQYIWATERIARAGLQDRVEVLLCDYRDLTGQYDKLVSIEMIEAVGQRYLPTFFRPVRRGCAREDGWRFRPSPFRTSAIATTAKASILSSATFSPAASCRASPR
jgi:cyclopropane fatty-acyl-phospholipid synthase-like methyltransferase